MTSRFYWRRAHPVRLPDRDTKVHAELRAAREAELRRDKRIEAELAALIEVEILAMEMR